MKDLLLAREERRDKAEALRRKFNRWRSRTIGCGYNDADDDKDSDGDDGDVEDDNDHRLFT